MTKTTIVTALRIILSLAIAGPAQAWPGQPDGAGIERGAMRSLWRSSKPAHPHIRKVEHAPLPLTARLPDREEDPLASMHFE